MSEPFQQLFSNRIMMNRDHIDENQLILGITTRHGGVSKEPFATFNMGFHVHDKKEDVVQNRKRLAKSLDLPLDQWIAGEQVHDTKITKVTKKECGLGAFDIESAISGTDGLYTEEKNVLLTACYADCVPLYFYTRDYSMVGIAHAGWRGTVGNIGGKMVQRWINQENIQLEDIFVVIGPSIGGCCYEVDERVITQVNKVMKGHENNGIYTPTTPHHYMLDLKKLNQQLLLDEQVPEENIAITSYCTSCQTDLFYSHRKENGKTGRILGYISLV